MELFQNVFPKYLQKAQDTDIYAYVNAQLNVYEYLYKIDPSFVIKIEYGMPIDASINSDVDFRPLLNQLLEAKRQIIIDAINKPHSIPSQEEVISSMVPIIKQLNMKYGDENITLFYEGKYNLLPVNTASSIIIDFYKLLLNSGPQSAGVVIRYIANQSLSSK